MPVDMDAFTELSKYGATGVAIAAIAALVYVSTKFITYMQITQKEHTASLNKLAASNLQLAKSTERSARASEQTLKATEQQYQFMKNLNGKLEAAIKERVTNPNDPATH